MLSTVTRAFLVILVLLGPGTTTIAKVQILVELAGQRMTVKKPDGDTLIWPVSTGRPGFDTPAGIFGVERMDAHHFSDEYDQAPMPYAIFFSRGLAIHGTYERGLGRPASHGCVRLSVKNARDLFSWIAQYGASIEIVENPEDSLAQSGVFEVRRPVANQGVISVWPP